ncbi:putative ribonuclease H-like domain-containing protein [Tanacetum coccineum]
MHVKFIEEKPNVKGVGYRWMFDIDYLTDSMNYIPVSLENQTNPHLGTSEVTNSAVAKHTAAKNEAYPTGISEDTLEILAFRRELGELAQKHLREVPKNKATSTTLVNSGSGPVNSQYADQDDSDMPELTIFNKPQKGIFDEASYDDEGVVHDFNNLPTEVAISPIPTLRIYNIHPQSQILGNPKSSVQTRSRVQQHSGAHALLSDVQKLQKNNHKDQHHCLFACFLSQEEPKKIFEALKDDSLVEAMQDELLQFKLQQVWILVDLPHGAKVIGTKSVYRNKRDERGVVVRNKARLVAQGHRQEEGIDYDEVFAPVARIEAIRLFLALTHNQVTPKTSHLNVVKRIFKYLKGKPNLGLWYPRESSFDLIDFSDSDYAGANLDRKSTTGGCQFLGSRLISWQCKKQTIVATSTTEAEYVAAASCCGQVLWIQNQMLDYGFNFMNTKIHIDNESTICIVKNPVYHSKTKHIEIRHHFIRDSYKKKLIRVEKIHTDFNVADLLTKAFDGPRFNFLVVNIGHDENQCEPQEEHVESQPPPNASHTYDKPQPSPVQQPVSLETQPTSPPKSPPLQVIVKLVKRVKKLETRVKYGNLPTRKMVISDSESKDAANSSKQGRNLGEEDVFETPKGKDSGETDISPSGLQAAETLVQVASQKTKIMYYGDVKFEIVDVVEKKRRYVCKSYQKIDIFIPMDSDNEKEEEEIGVKQPVLKMSRRKSKARKGIGLHTSTELESGEVDFSSSNIVNASRAYRIVGRAWVVLGFGRTRSLNEVENRGARRRRKRGEERKTRLNTRRVEYDEAANRRRGRRGSRGQRSRKVEKISERRREERVVRK